MWCALVVGCATPLDLAPDEINNLIAFVRDALTDPGDNAGLCGLIPDDVPSGFTGMRFEVCSQSGLAHNF